MCTYVLQNSYYPNKIQNLEMQVEPFFHLESKLLKGAVRASPIICTTENANFANDFASFARNKKLQSQGRALKHRERFISNGFFLRPSVLNVFCDLTSSDG